MLLVSGWLVDPVLCTEGQMTDKVKYIAAIREALTGKLHTVILIPNEANISGAIACTPDQGQLGFYGGRSKR